MDGASAEPSDPFKIWLVGDSEGGYDECQRNTAGYNLIAVETIYFPKALFPGERPR